MDVSKDNVQNLYPLSPTQEGMLFHLLAGDDPEAYVQQVGYRIRGHLDAAHFEAAWNQLIRRHDILRTAIVHTNAKQPLQVVLKQRRLDFRYEDLTTLASPAQAEWLGRFQTQDRATSFDPSRAMLMRVALLRLAPDLHEVLWSHHHLITDGWSIGVLQNELVEIYRALVQRQQPNLPAAPPYSRYIRFLESLDAEAGAAYWRRTLAGYTQPASIPATASGSQRQPAEHTFAVPTALAAALDSLARDTGVTLNTVLQSLWAVLLGRYSSQGDVVFGTVVSGRPPEVPGIDRMAGLFVNTVPLRIRIAPSQPLRQLLSAVQRDALDRAPYEYFPLAKAQAESELKHNLIAVVTAMENYPVERQIQAARTSETLGFHIEAARVRERTHYDLLLQFLPGPELVIKFQFNAAVHHPEAIAQLARQYQQLLNAARPDATVAMLQHALAEPSISSTAAPQPEAPTITRLIEAQAATQPDAVAIICEGESLTYGDLNQRANRLARHLQSLGVTRETRVGICCERSTGLIVSMLAVWKAGGAFVPMDPAYPAERLAYIANDAALHLVIADDPSRGTVKPDAGAGEDATNLPIETVPAQAAYIIYTSGSTGRPKGCVVTQNNVSRLFTATANWFHFSPSDVWTLFHSAAFDFSVWEIWGALAYGGRLVIVPYWISRSPDDFLNLLAAARVTVLNQTPSAFRQLLAAGLPTNLALRVVIFGGEALNLQSLTPWFDSPLADHAQLVNMYGITETTVHVTYRVITREDVAAGLGSRIGVPIPDLSIALTDTQGLPVPAGVSGEIQVGGAGVARGYWNRPALTAERFLPDPNGPPGSRLYRSGDLARRTPDHDLEYLGRADDQVKIRGFRIELGEIESAISGFAGVREVVVIAPPAGDEKKLAAYVAGALPDGWSEALRAHLEARLPAYMIPAAFVLLEKLPLTAHGKVDRKALPTPGRITQTRHRPPSTPVEQALAEVWAQVLGVSNVGIDDSYLELGGDSITAIRIVSALLSRKLKIGVRDLFRYPTIAELALHAQPVAQATSKPTAHSRAPLAPVQAWFFAQHSIDPHWFNHAVWVHLPVDADEQAIAKAWQVLWAHHEALRLRFVQHNGALMQELSNGPCPPIESLSPDQAQQGFDLNTGPLLRLSLNRNDRECRLLIVVHHLIIDAISWQVLLEDFARAYRGMPLEPAGSYLAWCAAQQTPPQALARTNAGGTYGEAEHQTLQLSPTETEDLLGPANAAYTTTTEDLLLAALAIALYKWTGAPTHATVIESHGRAESDLDLSRTIGWFTSMQTLSLDAAHPDTGYLIRNTKESLRRLPRTGVHLDPDALLRFNYLGNPGGRMTAQGFSVSTEGVGVTVSPRAPRPVPLDLSALVVNGQMEITLAFDPNQHSPALLSHYRDALAQVIRHCLGRDAAEVTPSDLTYTDLSLEELDRMLL